ncbi:MAG: DNA recombination protein RmuC [Candidatus Levybacteria bacterium]|nr:DNA recombination protein RmuC [Candidatus Levybacteria bacterium]
MDMQLLLIVLFILSGFIITVYFLNKKISNLQNNKSDAALLEWLKSMESSVHLSSTNMVKTLQENSKQLNDRLDRAATVIHNVGKEVGQMSEIGRSMKELQDFLKSPKLRGNIGEQVLKDLISQMFPKNSFHIQYQFKSGERVDAAIQTDAGILPIDSKFPMENFQKMSKAENDIDKALFEKEFARDVKKHISSIGKKYILPEEGTMDFALMYVPSESVYYELVNMMDVMDFAKQSRVYVVSPTTLYAHLQTILLSFEGKKIESRSRDLFKMLRALQVDYNKVEENMLVLGKHINNASSQFVNVNMGITQIGQKINSTKSLEEKENKLIEN